ncbi:uncharacterized protein LOC127254582 [Andrographis paniculata]|uniref:uncharacterized protein LOC127254582 n=1 Tax=Andrographis paniculata TaxID=175694 RepID=UPI0021E88844|nr:uncharacterized protein LOC127254582 [Andrographis paniculata]
MLLQGWSDFGFAFRLSSCNQHSRRGRGRGRGRFGLSRLPLRCAFELAGQSVSADDVAAVFHNKVLVSAVVSAGVGQVLKPFTSKLLYGKKIDLKAAVGAGGFPSTHSSAAVAAATALALERGFADAVFGLAVVYAGLTMYDSQGVRREVGIHAKELNKVLLKSRLPSGSSREGVDDLVESFSRESASSSLDNIDNVFLEKQSTLQTKPKTSSLFLKSDGRKPSNKPFINSSSAAPSDFNGQPESTAAYSRSNSLKESIGHTETEVAAGALLGFLVSFAIFPYL